MKVKLILLLFALPVFLFLFFAALPKNSSAAVGCVFSPASVTAGETIGVISSDLTGSRTIYIQTYGGPLIPVGTVVTLTGQTQGNGTGTIPTSATAPAYQVRVDSGFGAPITCADPNGVVGGNLTVTAASGGGGCDAADVNNDGKIDIQDTQIIASRVGGVYSPTYDLDGDGQITTADVNIASSCASGNGPSTATVECDNFADCIDDPPPTGFTASTFVADLVSKFLPIALAFGGFLTVIIIVISGIQFVTSSGNPDGAAAARGRLTFALIGFILLVLAFIITRVIDQAFLKSGAV